MKKVIMKSVLFVAMMSAASVQAAQFDGRQDAMGGTGVSGAHYKSGALFNPALVAKHDKDAGFAVVLPTVGVVGRDRGDMVSKAQDIQDAYDGMDEFLGMNSSSATQEDKARASELSGKASDALLGMDGKVVDVEAGVNVVFTVPMESFSFALHASTNVVAHAVTNINENDLQLHEDPFTGAQVRMPIDKHDLESTAIGYGAATTDIGLTLAKGFDGPWGQQWVGITPKFQRIDVANITSNVADNSALDDLNDMRTNKNGFNVDIGYATELPHNLVAGAVAKNIISQKLSAPLTSGVQAEYTVSPVLTASLTWAPLDALTVSGDVDLTPAKHFTGMAGVDAFDAASDDVQMLGVGAEYDLARWFQVRGGYKQNLVGDKSGMLTAGVGISPFDVFHLDLAGSYGGKNEAGVTLQTSLTF
ncbi:hypothetical protein D3C87_504780 [compost metagenome]